MADDSLAGLAGRVAQLEQGAAAAVTPPAFSSLGGLLVKPDGSIGYEFEGHVRAQGLDLVAGAGPTPPADRRIQWLDAGDGSMLAQLGAWNGAGGSAGADWTVSDGANAASLLMDTQGAVPAVTVSLSQGIGQRGVQLFGIDGASSFLQLGDTFGNPLTPAEWFLMAFGAVTLPAIGVGSSVSGALSHGWGGAAFYRPWASLAGPGANLAGLHLEMSGTDLAYSVGNPSSVTLPAGISLRACALVGY